MATSSKTHKLEIIRLDKRQAREAARQIDDLLLPLGDSIDFSDCVLMGLRGRVRSRAREVPAAPWPELQRFLDEAPGLLRSLVPYRDVDDAERRDLVGALMYFHVVALLEGGIDPTLVLASEGLMCALIAEPQRIAGAELIEFVADVQRLVELDFGPHERSATIGGE